MVADNGKSRQVLRKEQRDAFKRSQQEQKQANMLVRRQELVPLLQLVQTLRNRVSSLELTTAAIYKVLTDKSIVTDAEFNEMVEHEQGRAVKFKEVQQSRAPYEERVQICREWNIPVIMTVIPEQIKDDHTLDIKDKLALAEKFSIPIELVGGAIPTKPAPEPDDKPDS